MKLKKILLLLLFVGLFNIPVIVKAAPANSAFNDENFYKCIIDNINDELGKNYDYTHVATDEELGELTGLYCSSYSGADYGNPPAALYPAITDFTGMNKLVNIEELNISQSGASTVDLSANTKLRILVARNSSFTSIDLSHNTELVRFFAQRTPLTSVDFSHNENLEYVEFYSDELASVNLGTINKITHFYTRSPLLTTIDLSHLVDLDYLYLTAQTMESIDLSHNTKLDTMYLAIDSAPSIDLSNLTKLAVLHLSMNNANSIDLTHNKELYILDLLANKITSLDLSKNDKLGYLTLITNLLKGVDLTHNPELKEIVIFPTHFTSALDFSNNTKLESLRLNLYGNNVSLDLSHNRKLDTLYVGLTDDEASYKLSLPPNVDVNVFSELNSEDYANYMKVREDDPVGVYECDTSNDYINGFPSFTTKENGSTIVKLFAEDESIKRDITLVVTGAETEVEVPNTVLNISKLYLITSLIFITAGFSIILHQVYEKPSGENKQ